MKYKRLISTCGVVGLSFLYSVQVNADDDTSEDTFSSGETCNITSESEVRTRCQTSVKLYLGAAYDQFSGEHQKYLNYDAEEAKWRHSLGVNFNYGIIDNDHYSLWLTGNTLRGVRNAEVECNVADGETPPAVCTDLGKPDENYPDRARYLIRNATSYEATVGLRLEFKLDDLLTWGNKDNGSWTDSQLRSKPALYLKAELGGIAIDGDDDDIADMDNFAVGLIMRNGPYRGSFFEVGKGKNEIFADHPKDRFRIKARFEYNEMGSVWGLPTGFFIQTNLDADRKDGGDSIQTYTGFTLSFN